MKRDLSQLAWGCITGIVLAMALVHWAGCGSNGGSAEAQTRTALDAFALAVEPAWSFSNEACAVRQRAIASDVEAGKLTPAESQELLVPVRQRCHAMKRAFQAIREAQDQAADLVEAGKLQEAEAWLERLRERWAALRAVEVDGGAS